MPSWNTPSCRRPSSGCRPRIPEGRGSGSEGIELVVTNLNGKVVWRWSPKDSVSLPVDYVQPPVVDNKGRVLVSTGRAVAAVSRGALVWEFLPPDGTSVRYLTAFSGGTALVAAGKTLYALSSNGKILWQVAFDETLSTPPVVDHKGTIYVAGPRFLYRVK
ncbi:MAG: hypothetical protein D3924_16670 [Candidatus Electrothrix sp. AR4]|nr:hypothetical protein [Candidatus Electrothrix sp. AR4]